jgi:hypothetical protein
MEGACLTCTNFLHSHTYSIAKVTENKGITKICEFKIQEDGEKYYVTVQKP